MVLLLDAQLLDLLHNGHLKPGRQGFITLRSLFRRPLVGSGRALSLSAQWTSRVIDLLLFRRLLRLGRQLSSLRAMPSDTFRAH